MNRSNALRVIAFVVVAAIYVAVRFWNLTATCLWFDEIFSVHAAEHPWNSILDFVALDLIHPPLFYLILKIWIAAGGESLFWLRSLPVLFSIIAIVPFWLLCREIRLGFWTAVFAFLLIAVNGSLIKYAQEVRMYSMLMCMSLFSIWLFVRFVNVGRGLILLTVVNLILAYTHYFGWFVVASEIVAMVILQRSRWRSVALSAGITFTALTPWLYLVLKAANSGSELSQNIGWMQRPGFTAIAQLLLSFVEPFYYQTTSADSISNYIVSVPLLIIALSAIIFYFIGQPRLDTERFSTAYLISIFVAVPLICAFFASWVLPYSVWGTRHLIIVFIPALILIADAVTHLRNLKIRTFAVTISVLFICYAFIVQARRPVAQPVWCGFDPIAEKLQAQLRGPIYVFEDLAAYHLWFRFRNFPDAKFRQRVIKVDVFPGMTEDKAYFIPRGMDDEFLTRGNLPTEGAYWIVYRATSFDLTKPPLDTLTMNGLMVTQREVYDGGDSKIYAVYLEGLGDK